jgi:hypothetical protein
VGPSHAPVVFRAHFRHRGIRAPRTKTRKTARSISPKRKVFAALPFQASANRARRDPRLNTGVRHRRRQHADEQAFSYLSANITVTRDEHHRQKGPSVSICAGTSTQPDTRRECAMASQRLMTSNLVYSKTEKTVLTKRLTAFVRAATELLQVLDKPLPTVVKLGSPTRHKEPHRVH